MRTRSYGGRGWAIIIRFINLLMLDIEPLSAIEIGLYVDFHLFIEAFLFPEVISIVIAKEYQCALDEGFHLAWLSEPFGLAEFPGDNKCSVLRRVQQASSVSELKRQYDMGEVCFADLRVKSLVGPKSVLSLSFVRRPI